ncbi:hypothetical protein ACGYLI_12265 [Sulfitobacter sp. 1A13421]|uniref:hypothetical protein n=1 Tax=Sulfitobacter sp. 1A13421 TaxID=3368595 RepID=UPI003745ABB6
MPRFAPLLALPLSSLAMAAFAHSAPLPHSHGGESDGSLAVYAVAGLAFAVSGVILVMRHLKTAKA